MLDVSGFKKVHLFSVLHKVVLSVDFEYDLFRIVSGRIIVKIDFESVEDRGKFSTIVVNSARDRSSDVFFVENVRNDLRKHNLVVFV